jgi:hypothetical protein
LVVPQGVKINRLLKLRQNVVPRGGIELIKQFKELRESGTPNDPMDLLGFLP